MDAFRPAEFFPDGGKFQSLLFLEHLKQRFPFFFGKLHPRSCPVSVFQIVHVRQQPESLKQRMRHRGPLPIWEIHAFPDGSGLERPLKKQDIFESVFRFRRGKIISQFPLAIPKEIVFRLEHASGGVPVSRFFPVRSDPEKVFSQRPASGIRDFFFQSVNGS